MNLGRGYERGYTSPLVKEVRVRSLHSLFYYGAFVLLLALAFLLALPNSSWVFYMALFPCAFVCAGLLFSLIKDYQSIKFSRILALALLNGYAIGALNTVWRMGVTSYESFLGRMGLQQELVSVALVLILVSISVLFLFGKFERPIQLSALTQIRVQAPEIQLVLIFTIFVTYCVVSGGIGFQGVERSEGGRVNEIAALGTLLNVPLGAIAFYCMVKSERRSHRVLMFICFFLLELYLIVQGRRVFVFSLVLCAFSFVLTGRHLRILEPKVLRTILIVGLVAYFGTKMFFSMRKVEGQFSKSSRNYSLVDHVSLAWRFWQSGNDLEKALSQNLETRSFIISYVARLYRASSDTSPLYGRILFFSVEMAVPSAMHPNKAPIIAIGGEESLVNPHYGITNPDTSNTIVATGMADFGLVGLCIYPLCLVLIVSWYCHYVLPRLYGILLLMPIFTFIYMLFSVEQLLTFYVSTMRDLTLVLIMMFLVYRRLGRFAHNSTSYGGASPTYVSRKFL